MNLFRNPFLKDYWISILVILVIISYYFKDLILFFSVFFSDISPRYSIRDITHNDYFFAFISGYIVIGILADFLMKEYTKRFWNKSIDSLEKAPLEKPSRDYYERLKLLRKHMEEFKWSPRRVGVFERVLYTSAVVINKYEFIAVWLAFKVIGEWKDSISKTHAGRVRTNNFILGNSLSIIFGVLGGILFKTFIENDYLLKLINIWNP